MDYEHTNTAPSIHRRQGIASLRNWTERQIAEARDYLSQRGLLSEKQKAILASREVELRELIERGDLRAAIRIGQNVGIDVRRELLRQKHGIA